MASTNDNTQPAKNVPRVYSLPAPTQTYAESIIVESWNAYADDDRQITTYRGLQNDLVAVGIAPAQIFDDVGKAGKKSARLRHENGDKCRIEIERMARGEWRVTRYHSLGDVPYQSHKSTFTPQNGEMCDLDSEKVERDWLIKKLGFREPCREDSEMVADTAGPIRASAIINYRGGLTTRYSGSKDRLFACGLLTPDMFKGKRTKHCVVSLDEGDRGETVYHVHYYHEVIELSQDEHAMAKAELAKMKPRQLRRPGPDDDSDDEVE